MKKYQLILSIIFILTSLSAFYTIIISKDCKKKEILNILQSVGVGFLTECYNEVEIKDNVKKLVRSNEFIYNVVANIKIKLLPNFGKSRDIYQKLNFNKNYEETNFNEVKNLKGIISDENILKKYDMEKILWK